MPACMYPPASVITWSVLLFIVSIAVVEGNDLEVEVVGIVDTVVYVVDTVVVDTVVVDIVVVGIVVVGIAVVV